jgi:chromosome segregation ATPase
MNDDLVKRLRSNELSYRISDTVERWDKQRNEAADRIEKLEASEAEWQPICDSYAAENQRFSDRIEKLEAALREILSLGDWGANPLARTIALEALKEKDENP